MNDLLPCPFCGGEAHVERIGKSGYFYVSCNTPYCCDFGKADTEADAIAAWNTRHERTCHKVIPDEMEGYVFCSKCGVVIGEYEYSNYCPNCGAKVIA